MNYHCSVRFGERADCGTNVGGLLGPCQREEEGAILGDWSLPDCVISERLT